MKSLISVIVPVYNNEKYLEQCIESIIGQTYKNIEIILVNDGSTDNSLDICYKYAAEDNRIKVINKLNGGVTSARKLGMLNATGDYIGFVDSDDYIAADMYEKLYKSIIEKNADVVISLAYKIVKKEQIYTVNYGKNDIFFDMSELNNELYNNIFSYIPPFWNAIYKKKHIEKYLMNVMDNIYFGEDVLCLFQVIINSSYVYFISEPLYFYRKMNESYGHSKNIMFYDNINNSYISFTNSIKNLKNKDILYKQICQFIYYTSLEAPKLLFDIDNIHGCLFVFPFEKIERNSDVIIYGAGMVGRSYYTWAKNMEYCNVVLWVDNDYKKLLELGYNVDSPDRILDKKFDYIIIAQKYEAVLNDIAQNLIQKYNIDKEKIIYSKPKELSDFII